MSIRDLLASSGSGGIIVDTQTFTASGTWTKPAGALPSDIVIIDLWGGGGPGAVRGDSSLSTGAGGGGGAHNRQTMRVRDLNATETVTVGTGGAAATATNSSGATGSGGGYSEFKGHRAYGGGAGGTGTSVGGTGGGIFSAGINATNNARGGEPLVLGAIDTSRAVTVSSATLRWYPGEWGGGNADASMVEPNYQTIPIHGGAGAVNTWNLSLRGSVWGGAAGGAYDGSTAGTQTGGTSQFGGNGGSVAIPASTTSNVNGGNGSPRGGGGSGAKWGSTGTVTSGAGGRGEVVITIIRGG